MSGVIYFLGESAEYESVSGWGWAIIVLWLGEFWPGQGWWLLMLWKKCNGSRYRQYDQSA